MVESVKELNKQLDMAFTERDNAYQEVEDLKVKISELLLAAEQVQEEKSLLEQTMREKLRELESGFEEQITAKEQSAISNINYLKRRLKELSQTKSGESSKQQQCAFLKEVKNEFEKVSEEVLEIRAIVKQECMDKASIGYKLKVFEDFRLHFHGFLEGLEEKGRELLALSEVYN